MTVISVVGITVHDIVFGLERLPRGAGKNHATSLNEIGGGVAANAAHAIARLGATARLFSAVGSDRLGDLLVEDLSRAGVDTNGIRRSIDVASPISAVMVDAAGDRSIVNYTAPSLFDRAQLPEQQELSGSDAVLVDVRWPQAAEVALNWAKEAGVPGVVDYDVGRGESNRLLDLASHVVFAAPALRNLTGENDLTTALREISSQIAAWVAVTDGTAGTWSHNEGVMSQHPSHPIEAVDTTGAGDVFHGVFTLFLAETGDESVAITNASAAAALSCTMAGGREGAPDLAALTHFLEETND